MNATRNLMNVTMTTLRGEAPTLGSQTARGGFQAENIFITNINIKNALERHFCKPIKEIKKAPPRMKYDTVICFTDGTELRVQNKKIKEIGGRGDSFDRRCLEDTFENTTIKTLLHKLCIEREISDDEKRSLEELCQLHSDDIIQYLQKTLVGNTTQTNEYWSIMKMDEIFDHDSELYLIETRQLFSFILESLNPKVKRTCLHLCDHIYLQRKGGTTGETRPNQIQAKLKISHDILNECTRLL